ncbi:hypothetical protein [Heliophilum fasciatum]|nr:hypothetical protein [Heliophilum fasciatum]MCW2277160.1 hypothetical protein [Heliophilum fasciatum]
MKKDQHNNSTIDANLSGAKKAPGVYEPDPRQIEQPSEIAQWAAQENKNPDDFE